MKMQRERAQEMQAQAEARQRAMANLANQQSDGALNGGTEPESSPVETEGSTGDQADTPQNSPAGSDL